MSLIIGIPTFNRPDKALNLALKITKFLDEETELLIVENKSNNMIDNSRLINKRINYFKKNKNQGLDKSIIQIICYAKRKNSKLWFLSDDDILYEDSINHIISKLKKSESDVIYVPWENDKGIYKKLTLMDSYLRMSFLPCIAINPQKLILNDLKGLINTNYIHIGVINQLLKSLDQIEILDKTAGIQTKNLTSRFDIFNTFIIGYYKCLTYKSLLSKKIINKVIFNMIKSSMDYLKFQKISFDIFLKYLKFCFQIKNISLFLKLKFLIKLFFIKWI